MSTVITVSINGEARQLPSGITVAALIEEMGLAGKRIALERNGEIVPRGQFEQQLFRHEHARLRGPGHRCRRFRA